MKTNKSLAHARTHIKDQLYIVYKLTHLTYLCTMARLISLFYNYNYNHFF
jgi:hypothetical protein